MKNNISQSQKPLLTKRVTFLHLSIYCWKILQSETFNEPYASVFLGCVLPWSQHRAGSQQRFPRGSRALPGPRLRIPQTWLLPQLPLLAEELQRDAFPKCQNPASGEEKSALGPLSPCSLSCHFMKLKSETSLLYKHPDKGVRPLHSCRARRMVLPKLHQCPSMPA